MFTYGPDGKPVKVTPHQKPSEKPSERPHPKINKVVKVESSKKFYQQWWFWLIIVLVILVSIFLMYRSRENAPVQSMKKPSYGFYF